MISLPNTPKLHATNYISCKVDQLKPGYELQLTNIIKILVRYNYNYNEAVTIGQWRNNHAIKNKGYKVKINEKQKKTKTEVYFINYYLTIL